MEQNQKKLSQFLTSATAFEFQMEAWIGIEPI